MKRFLLFIVSSLTFLFSHSQDFSNKGKDFWTGYGYHEIMVAGNAQDMVLYFATDVVTTVTVTIPGVGYSQTFANIPANTIFETPPMPKAGAQDARLMAEQLYNKGIHIVSDKPIVAYAHIYNASVSGATLLFPTNTLGKEYYSINYKNISNSANSNCWFYVEAADTGTTTVEITPSAATLTHPANVTFSINLTQGQIYNVMGALTGGTNPYTGVDLTGSLIKSVSTGLDGGCKRIAVFSGSGRIAISCNGLAPSSDNYMVQALPKTAWGKEYLTVPTGGNMTHNIFRICVSDPTAIVKFNGAILTGLVNNFYYEVGTINIPSYISSDKPIVVAQYITSQGACGNGSPGDPEVIYLSPIEQNINRVLLNSTPHYQITQHYINVVLTNSGTAISSFRLDNAIPTTAFVVHPQNPAFSYLQQSVAVGKHEIRSDSGFNAIAYGYGQTESYGYNAGTNVKDLYQFVGIITPYSIVNQPSACANTPFTYAITLPYQPLSMVWDFHGYQVPNTVSLSNPTADSTYFINSKQVWRYKLPATNNYLISGVYPVTVTVNNPTAEGCSGEQDIDFDLNVYDPPNAKFSYTNNGCVTDSVHFTDTTFYTTGTYSYKWFWDFGDGTTDSVHNPVHKYLTPGNYTVAFHLISNVGCLSDTAFKTITVTLVPLAKFGISSILCSGSPVTFTDSSLAYPPGALGKWYWDYGDGIRDTVLDSSRRFHTYSPFGARTVSLKVETVSGCQSPVISRTFQVNAVPSPDFIIPAGLCLPSDSAHFFDASTIADNTTPFTYLWTFGDPPSGVNNTSALKNPVHYYNNAGPFTINLHVISSAGCFHDTSKTLSTVYPQTHSDFSVNPEYCLHDSTFVNDITNPNPYTITNWYWDFGDGQTSTTGPGTFHIYGAPGTYSIKLHIRTDKGCYSDTMTRQVIINQLPTARFGYTALHCAGVNVTFTDSSVANSGVITGWKWDLGDGTIINNSNNNPVVHSYLASGSYTVTLTVTTDKGCRSAVYSQLIVIHPLPIPDFTMSGVCLPSGFAQFTNQSTVPDGTIPASYSWNFGDPGSGALNTSILTNPQHIYSSVGPFTVTLTVTSVGGCVSTTSKSLTQVYAQPHADFNVNAQNCLNDSSRFTDISNGFGGIVNEWHWNFGDGQTSTLQNPVHLYSGVGTYSITLYIKTDRGCISDTMTKQVTVNPLPTAKFGFSLPDCVSLNVTFTDSSIANAGSISSWNWDLGDGTLLVLNNNLPFTHQYMTAGTYAVKLHVTTNNGCVSLILTKQVIVHPTPVPDFTSSLVCLPDGVAQFTNQSTISDGTQASFTYQWNFGDPVSGPLNFSTLTNPQHHYTTPGPFNVTLTVTSNSGCSKDSAKQITQIYAQPHANFFYTLNSQSCLNDSTHFVDSSKGFGGLVIEWHWDFGDGQSSTVQNPVHLYASPGTYNVSLHVKTDKGCLSDTTTKPVTITPLPTANFGFTNPDCINKIITFTDSSLANGGTITAWNWNLGDGTLLNNINANPFTHTYLTTGTFTVTLKVTTNSGCISLITSKQVTIHSLPVPNFSMTAVCLPDGISNFTNQSTVPDGTIPASYSWNFGDPGSGALNISTLTNPQHRYSSVGPFTITLTATSVSGCVDSVSKQLTLVYPQPHAGILAAAENCLGDTTFFTDNSNGSGSTVSEWHWNFGDGQSSTIQNPSHVYAVAGTYTTTLYIKTDKGCISDTFPRSVTVNPLPTSSFTVSPPVCETKTVTFSSTSVANAGALTTWNWNLGDGTILTLSAGTPFPHVYAAVGTYTATLSVQTNKGCRSGVFTRPVTVHAQPVPNFILPGVCLSDAFAQFLDSSYISDGTDSSFTYLWNFGDPTSGAQNTSALKNPVHRYLAAAIYTVTLTVTSSSGCVSVKSKQLSVNGTVPQARFLVLNPGGLCSNTNVQIRDSSRVADFGVITRLEVYWDAAGTPGIFNTYINPTPFQVYSHLYPNFQSPLTKVYTVKVRAFSGGTCVDQQVQTVTVNATPRVQFNPIPDTCFNATPFTITEASETGGVPGSGVFTGSGINALGQFDPSVAGVGPHVIRYTYTSNKGCVDFQEQTINVVAPPVAGFIYGQPSCATQAVTFTDSSRGVPGVINKWTWNFGDGSAPVIRFSGAPFTHIFPSAQSYSVSLTVTTSAGCSSIPFILPVTVNPLPVPKFSMPKVCLPNASSTFTDNSTIADGTAGQFRYQWDFGDPNSGTLNTDTVKNPTHIYTALGPYSVHETVTSVNGCVKDTIESFNDIHPQPTAKFLPSQTSVCQGNTITFTDQSNGADGNITNWYYTFGDGGTDTRPGPDHPFNTAGNFAVKLYVVNSQGCSSAVFQLPVNIYAFPQVNAGPNVSVLEGGSIVLQPTVTGNQLQYLWSPPDYLSSTTIKNPIVTGKEDRTYTLTVTGQGGCTAFSTISVKVLKFPVIPNTFTPNGDGINDTWVIDHLETYPNCRVQVFNRYGQLVFESVGYTSPWNGTMNGKLLPWGTYYYVIEPGSGRKPITGYVTIIK